ncbi:hypothetical protein J3F83DRAFT_251752 [Trichoderma novae-zelandiae]
MLFHSVFVWFHSLSFIVFGLHIISKFVGGSRDYCFFIVKRRLFVCKKNILVLFFLLIAVKTCCTSDVEGGGRYTWLRIWATYGMELVFFFFFHEMGKRKTVWILGWTVDASFVHRNPQDTGKRNTRQT